ncbi:MAG: hypothetical protein A4E55_01954 [Pelotomaculum sp. PtaU1.Bin035]|nr:MAG: hypothetical protein A4E55_01954 [Pelotomaculum sp. PtaU1.Bin035]
MSNELIQFTLICTFFVLLIIALNPVPLGGRSRLFVKLIRTILFIFGLYLMFKAYTIYSIYLNGVDGDGIGIYLGPIEINDTALTKDLPFYAIKFAISGLALVIIPITTKLFRDI